MSNLSWASAVAIMASTSAMVRAMGFSMRVCNPFFKQGDGVIFVQKIGRGNDRGIRFHMGERGVQRGIGGGYAVFGFQLFARVFRRIDARDNDAEF